MNISNASSLLSPSRHLCISGEITYLTGAVLSFSGAQVLRFSMSEGAGEGILLGGAFSASCSLTLFDSAVIFTFPHSPKGAQARVFLEMEGEKMPLCVFTVSSVSREDGSSRLHLSGCDALGTAFEAAFQDRFSYPIALQAMAQGIAAQAGFSFPEDIPGGEIMIASPPVWGEASLRRVLAWVAEAAGCFALISREGKLIFAPAWPGEAGFEILPQATLKREYGEAAFGPLEGLSISLHQAPKDTPPLVVSSDSVLSGQNCLSLSGNPLLSYEAAHSQPLAQHLFSALQGMKLTQAKVTWRGDPKLQLGQRVKITDHSGDSQETLITSQSLIFSQGFSMQSDCRFSPSKSGVGRMFTPSGAINAAMLAGDLNGVLIRDGSIAARSILSGSITALQMAAHSITADKLAAGAVTAEKLSADSVQAKNILANAVEARHLSADALSAVDARIQHADIEWAEIDELTAVIANIASGRIENADIDFAHIKDLVTGTAIITQGVGGELYISRLAVTEANMVSLSVGQLLVKGEDGGFYALTVDESGNVITEKKQVGNDDIGNLSINAGEKLIEGSITAATLNVQDIFADSAIIRTLIAANMDVDTLFAREATLDAINALDIRGNQYLKLSVDALQKEIEASASDATGQQMTLSFSQGNAIEEERKSITASVHLWKNGEEITDQIPALAFSWERESGDDALDAAWNQKHLGVKEVTLTRDEIGKSCQLRCILDEAGIYGAFEIAEGRLIFTPPDRGVADEFSLVDGRLYGEEHYTLKDGILYLNAHSHKMQVTTSVFDHSILETSHILIKDNAIDIRAGGNIRIAAGGTLEMAASALKLTASTTLEDELQGNAQAAANAQNAADAANTAASNAQTSANQANTAASNAQSTADKANTAAGNAQSTADAANTAAGKAQGTADSASTAAANAQSTANSANTAAENAQNTANQANTAAGTAQQTANAANTAAGKAQSAADKAQSAADQNAADLNAQNIRITEAEAEIIVLSGEIALKADKTTVDTLTNRVAEAEAEIAVQAGEIALKVSQEEYDNLSVGGRNLLLGSDAEQTIQNSAATLDISQYGQALMAKGETTVVISFDAKADVATAIDHYPRLTTGATLSHYGKPTSITTQWKRYSQVYTYPGNTYPKYSIRSNGSVTGGSNTAIVKLKNIKLEAGNKATDWTPAPEDPVQTVKNTAMTLDANGIEMNTTGYFRLYANDGKNSRIKLGGDDDSANFSVDETGKLGAVSGEFSEGLTVGGQGVWTRGNIVISSSEPTGVHDVIWLKPLQGVEQVTHSYLNTSQGYWVHDEAYNYTLSPQSSDVLSPGGSYTYQMTLQMGRGSSGAGSKSYTMKAVLSTSAGNVTLNSAAFTLSDWGNATVTLTGSSATNLFSSAESVSAALSVKAPETGNTYLYLKNNTEIVLTSKNTAASGSGAQTCTIHYIP